MGKTLVNFWILDDTLHFVKICSKIFNWISKPHVSIPCSLYSISGFALDKKFQQNSSIFYNIKSYIGSFFPLSFKKKENSVQIMIRYLHGKCVPTLCQILNHFSGHFGQPITLKLETVYSKHDSAKKKYIYEFFCCALCREFSLWTSTF